jgi:alkanesulfonate monooxygenase SsuD/methylene tetrahydromethanopterin reductase-like flavin-dependent oxidoreductase (luciferase family)
MKFGLFSNNRRPKRRLGEGWGLDLAEARIADDIGFHEAWFSEHEAPAEPLIAKASAMTRQIKLGPAVRPLPFYHPLQIAIDANAADQLTNGRYYLGVGTGFRPHKIAWRGRDPELVREMTNESVEIVLRLLKNRPEPFDYEGRFWSGKELYVEIPPVQLPHPPIAMSVANSPDSAAFVGRHGLMMLTSDFAPPTKLRLLGDAMVRGQLAAGQAADRGAMRVCRVVFVGETDAQARDDLRQSYNETIRWEVANTPWHQTARIPPGGSYDDINFDYLVDTGNLLVGSPDTVVQRVEELYRSIGGFGTLLFHCGRDYATPEKVERSMRLFAQSVAPRLRDLTPGGANSLLRAAGD